MNDYREVIVGSVDCQATDEHIYSRGPNSKGSAPTFLHSILTNYPRKLSKVSSFELLIGKLQVCIL